MKLQKILFLFIFLFFPLFSSAEVIFSDDFEWGSDWNSSMTNTLPNANGWNGATANNLGGSYEAAYINSAGAKQGDRGFIQYWDQIASGAAQDIWLNLESTVFPMEYYIGYWYKIDPSWTWGTAANLKIIKTNFADASNETWDIVWTNAGNFLNPPEWFVVDGAGWTGDNGCVRTILTDAWLRTAFGCWSAIDDGQWHSFVWHINHTAGTLSLKIDDVDAFQMRLIEEPFGSPYSDGIDGTIRWNFGGNISNGGPGSNELYTAYDDLIIATTLEETTSFLNISSSDTTPPANPTQLTVN